MGKENLQFSVETKENIRKKQKNKCCNCGRETRLEIHHKVSKNFARKHTFMTQEVREYIRHPSNGVGMCPACHAELEENLPDIEMCKEVITLVLGACHLIEREYDRARALESGTLPGERELTEQLEREPVSRKVEKKKRKGKKTKKRHGKNR